MKVKRFYPKAVILYVSEKMKEELSNTPNMSEFIRIAIQEKLNQKEDHKDGTT